MLHFAHLVSPGTRSCPSFVGIGGSHAASHLFPHFGREDIVRSLGLFPRRNSRHVFHQGALPGRDSA